MRPSSEARREPVNDISRIVGELPGRRLRTTVIPGASLSAMSSVFGWASPLLKDLSRMVRWFQAGNYVADTRRRQEVFGPPPTAEQAIEAYLPQFGHRAPGNDGTGSCFTG